jgi:trehalose 6-phosphate synthase/phosphatase
MPRCLLVSNRLPVAFDPRQNGFTPSAGGLASAIRGLDATKIGFDFEWLGILTDDVAPALVAELRATPPGNLPCHPIVVPASLYNDYYNLYCNNVLWPLFHYERNMVRHNQDGWRAYGAVNELVAEAVAREARPGDVVWVHDFQLLLVPGFVKKLTPDLKVGFFLHIPFPSSEIFRELPQRKEILASLLRCDQIGFHDLSYLNHFRSSLQRVLGELPAEESNWGVYPISIDVEHFTALAGRAETQRYIEKYRKNKKQMKWILGVDRLDYIKGLLLKLSAYKAFLKAYPEEHEKVQLVQVVIPSRIDVPEYKGLKGKIEQLVSSINGEFGSPAWMPVQYIFHSVAEPELSALYQLSEVLHVGSRRDGMNLVSLEYVVSQQDAAPGVVLLSEFAGAHSTLSYAMSINPWNIHDTAARMREALHHPEVKRRGEMAAMREFLRGYTSSNWARTILRELALAPRERRRVQALPSDGRFPWMEKLRNKRVLFFCDLDGTLAPISQFPKDVRLQARTVELLQLISNREDCEFVIVSGRDKEFLEEQFIDNDIEFPLAACHGAYSYSPAEHRWKNLIPDDSTRWKEKVLEILNLYALRTPGSFIEDKGHAITWHYRNSPKEFAEFLAAKLFFELEETLANQPVQVNRGKKVIEVKSMHANKGYFVQNWLQGRETRPDVVVAIGDDTTDEDMFATLQARRDVVPYCIKVGEEKSHAPFFIKDQASVNLFLENFLRSIGL